MLAQTGLLRDAALARAASGHWPGAGLTAMVIFGGVQLIGLGILGEYIGRIYMEAKRRPPYLIKEMVQQETPPVAHLDGHSPYGKEQDAR